MYKILILGTASAIPREGHENTHFLIQGGDRTILVDCGANPVLHLGRAGVSLDAITDIVITHFHPDHTSGLPLLLMDMWLLQRRKPLNIYGLEDTLERVKTMMDLYDWKHWPGFYPIFFHGLPEQELTLALNTPELKLLTSPVKHFIPTIGLRVEFPLIEKSAAYSCDTEPCPQVLDLAKNADLLIHEAAGTGAGHSSAEQAAITARQAGAKRLLLIHYDITKIDAEDKLTEVGKIFIGKADLAKDFQLIDFG